MIRDGVILTPTLDVLSRTPFHGPELYEPVRYFASQGGRIALGNDFPYRRTDSGMPLREMHQLAHCGLTPHAVLTTATQTSAAACGFADRGTLNPGMKADMIIVADNPIQNLNALKDVSLIVKDGKIVSG